MVVITAQAVPSEGNVRSHFVDLPLVREAVVADIGKELEALVVWVHGVAEALLASLIPDKCLESFGIIGNALSPYVAQTVANGIMMRLS